MSANPFDYSIDWQTVASTWDGVNTVVKVILGGILAYTQGHGIGTLGAQVFRLARGPQMWAAYRRWATRPSRLDNVETGLKALLVRLGDNVRPDAQPKR